MRHTTRILLLLTLFTIVRQGHSQAWTMLGLNYLKTDASTDGVVIGNLGTPPSPTIGLLVDGNNLFTPTGEVFRTNAPSHTDTY